MPRLTEILWEGVSIIDGFYHAVYLGAGDYGIGFPIGRSLVVPGGPSAVDAVLSVLHT
jgi:hypothetical protein